MHRTTEQANSLIKVTAMVVAGLYLYRRFTEAASGEAQLPAGKGGPPLTPQAQRETVAHALPSLGRFVIGWGVVFVVLSIAAGPYPTLAGNMALLLMIASLIANGQAVSKDLGKGLESAKQGKRPHPRASGPQGPLVPGSVTAPPIPEVRTA